MRSIFPATIDGNLLKLVHLSNGFGIALAKPLRVGDVCYSEARIASVTNTDTGKVVKVKGHVYRTDAAVVEECFEWGDPSVPLQARTALFFRVQSQVTYTDKTSYRNVSVSGDIFVRDQLKQYVKVGSVDFQQDDCRCTRFRFDICSIQPGFKAMSRPSSTTFTLH
jgi:fatty acid synthase subunit alpha, fungi type